MKSTLIILLVSALAVAFSKPAIPRPQQRVAKREATAEEGPCPDTIIRTLREGLLVLKVAAKQLNLSSSAFRNDLDTFRQKVSALEFVCDLHLKVENETGQETFLETFRENTCSWLNTLNADFLPICTPVEIEFFCRQVKLYNLSHRAGKSLGTVTNTSKLNWFRKHLPEGQIQQEVREFLCQNVFNNSCSQLANY